MLKGSIRDYPILAKLLILIGLFLIGEFCFTLLSVGLIQMIYPDSNFYHFMAHLSEIKSVDEISSQQITGLKIFQLITSLGRFLCVPLLFIFLNGQQFIKVLHLDKKIQAGSLLLIVLIMFTAPGVINIVNEWNQSIVFPPSLKTIEDAMRSSEEIAKAQTDAFLSTTTITGLLLNILIVGMIAALGEEILFRGILQNLFWKWTKNIHLAIWIAAFIFSFIHFQFFGFFPRLLLGALLGYLYYWSGSLWANIFAHFVNNAASVVAYFLLQRGAIDENLTESSSWIAALISLPFVILLLVVFKRHQTKPLDMYGERLDDDLLNA